MSENSVNRARFRLAPHQDQLAAEVKLGGGQQALAEVEAGTHALVYGAAGTGKTVGVRALALRIAREQGPAAVVAVAASREAANLLRDQLALQFQGSTPGPMARTVSSLAFSILRQAALDSGFVEPELVSGPEQDRILKELLAPYAVGRDSEFAGAEFIASAQSLAELGFPKFVSPQVVGLRGFRAELRDLIAVAQENQIDPDRLAELGEQHDLPIWVGAAHFYRLYVERLREPAYLNRHDSATLLNVASEYVQGLSDGDRIPAVLAGLKTVIVDDAQELTKGAIRLLRSLAERGIGLVLVGDPDASVLGFRASDPRAMRDLMNELGSGIQPIVLEARDQARGSTLNDVLLKVANKISPELAGPQRAALARSAAISVAESEVSQTEDDDDSSALEVRVHDTPASEAAWLANRLRQLHLHDGLAWRSIAVVARSREALRQFEAELAAENVPVLLAGARAALRDEYASRELLTLLRFALEPRELTLEQAVGFLTGPYCGLDSLGLRRLRRSLRRQELEGEGNRTADELILEMFAAPGAAVTLKTPEGFLVADFLKSIEATRIEAAERATVDRLLWTLWSASKARKAWVELSPRLRKITFTGSTQVGVKLLEQSAKQVLRTSMELGGNAPFLVFEDADIDAAVNGAMLAKMRNIGQACTAANRFIIHDSVADEFAQKFSAKMDALQLGRGVAEGTTCGPVINEKARENMQRLVDATVREGGDVVAGGESVGGDGYFFKPTVLDNVKPGSTILQEEIFGPIAPIVRFKSEEEAEIGRAHV